MILAGPLARVLLRYVAAGLMAKAGVTLNLADPDIATVAEFFIGVAMSAGTEAWWYLARKYGWTN